MQKINELEIHKDSEIWKYEGQVEFTKELVDFFEEERKRVVRENKSDERHIAFQELESNSLYKSISKKELSVAEKVEVNILLKDVYSLLETLTETEKRRFTLHKILGLKMVEIAKLEGVDSSSVRETIKTVQKKLKDIEKVYMD